MSKKVKIFVTVIAIIAVAIGAFSYFGNSTAVPTNSTLSTSANVTTIPGGGGSVSPSSDTSTFTTMLSSIAGIKLDTSIFTDPGYKALRDYPVSLGTAVIGRPNPFAPIGSDGTAVTANNVTPVAAASLQVQTLAPGKILSTSAEFGALVTTTSTDPVTVVFQYGTTDAFGSDTAPTKVTKNGTALFTATGLLPATTYYVEAVAVQGSSTVTGTSMTFTTAAAAKKKS